MITYKYDLDIVTGSVPIVVPLKQYSDDCELIFNIYSELFGCYSLKKNYCDRNSTLPPSVYYVSNNQYVI